jgi:predicted nucleotidyltransferase
VFTADQIREFSVAVRTPFSGIFLYGSHARGDSGEMSDIDILQVTTSHAAPYAVGRVNVTCYTVKQLLDLAREGSLFARHLISEAQPLNDPYKILEAMKSAYVSPMTYDPVRREVCACAPLLDVDQAEYIENREGLTSLVTYLIRTYLYALAFDQGAQSFAMGHIVELLGYHEMKVILSRARAEPKFETFETARVAFERLTNTACIRKEGSLDAFIVNVSADSKLAMILGLRLLARGRPFTYDALQDVEFLP